MADVRTVADPDAVRAAVRTGPDPHDHSCVAVLGDEVVAQGFLEVRDAMGQNAGAGHRGAEALLGWNVSPDHWGAGIGTLVAGAMVDIAFGDLGIHRVVAGCFADNTASWRIMERIGMRREQHGIQDSWHAELGWVDGYTYAMLRSEWLERRG